MSTSRVIAVLLSLFVLALPCPARSSGEASALAWCTGDSGPPVCGGQYVAIAPQCLVAGARSCLMRRARDAAAADDCALAIRLARICQCHNPVVRDALEEALVCNWLRTQP
jgi:hypothetical protein